MSTGLLIRVGIDSTAGGWNAPCDAHRFCYVPMGSSKTLTEKYDSRYEPYKLAVAALMPESAANFIRWPRRLPLQGHFDPDFHYLTYGDWGRRAARIQKVFKDVKDRFIVFYAGLRRVDTGELSYSIIGFYAVGRVMRGPEVEPADWPRNEHTRNGACPDESTVIVFARQGESGRLREHIPIGSYQRRAYRVTPKLLEEWGDLDVHDGYIHRSVFLPCFKDGDKFLRWFKDQNPVLVSEDNPTE